MVKHRVVVCCWAHGHETEIFMTRKQEDKLDKQIPALKAVCPACRLGGYVNMPIFIKEGETLFGDHKSYVCRHHHVTTVSAFANDMLHVKYGNGPEDFVNIEGTTEELEELVDEKQISCHHVRDNGRECGCKLKAVDDATVSRPEAAGIKTKTRLGDFWDKARAEPVRNGQYDGKGNYQESHTEVANRERLKRMRERNIKEDRMPGKRIDKPTKKTYGRRSKSEVKPDRLR